MHHYTTKHLLLIVAAGLAAFAASVNLAQADWPNNNPTKWVQMPDVQFGMNVKATEPKILADDFLCTYTGPITDIHIWGSWLNDVVDPGAVFTLGIYSDVPRGPNDLYSHPGAPLWTAEFTPDRYIVRPWGESPNEPFLDPNINQITGFDNMIWQLNFLLSPTEAFYQKEGTIYWLSVQARTLTAGAMFGWKTSMEHWNDDAAWSDVAGGQIPAFWNELRDPRDGESLDLAFALTTIPEPGTGVLLGFMVSMILILRKRP